MEAATQTYQQISNIVEAIKNAPEEVNDIRIDAGNISKTMVKLKGALEEAGNREVFDKDELAQKHFLDLQNPLSSTQKTLDKILALLRSNSKSITHGTQYKFGRHWWTGGKEEFQILQAKLERDKMTLLLSMTGLNT